MLPGTVLRVLVSWLGRALIPLRWLRNRTRRSLRRLRCPGMQRTAEWTAWYQNLYRSVGERALQSGRPGERMPELILHDMEGNEQPLSRCWDKQPALLVTMSLRAELPPSKAGSSPRKWHARSPRCYKTRRSPPTTESHTMREKNQSLAAASC